MKVVVPEYPYDEFVIELDRDQKGALWRGQFKIATLACLWDGWEVNGAFVGPGALRDEHITAAIDQVVSEGRLALTRVPSLDPSDLSPKD
jgi:hypothetical protein